VNIGELNALLNSGNDFLLVDARSPQQYAAAHIPGAVSVPLDQIPPYSGSIDKNRVIVTYCGNFHCPISTKAAREFMQLGFANVYDYKGGIAEWENKGYSTAAGSG
jgi:rhodanese-related sulfurtransferase